MPRRKLLSIEDAQVLRNTNFRGEERRYNGKIVNEAGKRNICVIIDDPDKAQDMADDGWNIRSTKPGEDEDGNPIPVKTYLPVEIGYKFPPKIIMETEAGVQTSITEDTVDQLDEFEIIKIDIDISPGYYQKDDGSTGIKAWCNRLWILVEDDPWLTKHRRREED